MAPRALLVLATSWCASSSLPHAATIDVRDDGAVVTVFAAPAVKATAPASGLGSPVVGSVTGAAAPQLLSAVVYAQGGGAGVWWGPKAAAAVGASGAFSVAGWALSVNDLASPLLVVVYNAGYAPGAVAGAPLPAADVANAVAQTGVLARTAAPPPPPPPVGQTAISISYAPALGAASPVIGLVSVTGVAPVAVYRAWVYVMSADATMWSRSMWSQCPCDDAGVFSIQPGSWMSGPGDANAATLGVVVSFDAAAALPPLAFAANARLPQAVVALLAFARPKQAPPPPPAPAAAAGAAWPPAGVDAGPKQSGALINALGFEWRVIDTGGVDVPPGPGPFSGTPDFIWADAWGLHLNMRPTDGQCGAWASSQVELATPLGYGVYLWSAVGPMQFLDDHITFGTNSWDRAGFMGDGWSELDIEIARFGDPNDPNGAQFNFEPQRCGVAPNPSACPGMPLGARRFPLARGAIYSGGGGDFGQGGCNDAGAPDSSFFNGATTNHLTCATSYFPGSVQWRCWDGLWSLATVSGASLVASWSYPDPSFLPTSQTITWQFSVWRNAPFLPALGRRVHEVLTHFEHSTVPVDFVAMGFPANFGLAS